MTQSVAANITLPAVVSTLQASAKARAQGGQANSTSSTDSSGSSVQSTFLNLLVQELQNQDPTAPMDATAMVGQMISLNQLDELISIDELLGGSSSSSNGARNVAHSTTATTAAAATSAASRVDDQQTKLSQLPFDPATLMPLGFSAVPAALLNSPLTVSGPSTTGTIKNTGGK